MSDDGSLGGWIGTQTAKGLKAAFNNLVDRRAIKSRLSRWSKKLMHGDLTVLVLGAGGTGKTTLVQVLTSEAPLLVEEAYQSSASVEYISLEGELPVTFVVATGQDSRRLLDLRKDASWEEIFNVFQEAGALGFGSKNRVLILNVVSYGYHSFSGKLEDTEVYDRKKSKNEMMIDWLDKSRSKEMQRLEKLEKGLENLKRSALMITVISKQDLWRNETGVETYYSDPDSEYVKILKRIARSFEDSDNTFIHFFAKAPVKHQNLYVGEDADNRLEFKTAEGFSFSDYVVGLESLINTIDNVVRTEFKSSHLK
jgi:hypothetical protein